MKTKNILYSLLAVAVITVAGYNVTLSQKHTNLSQLELKNITMLSIAELTDAEINKLHYKCVSANNQWKSALKSRKCALLFWQSRLSCESVTAHQCCDASKQTNCSGNLIDISINVK